MGQCTKRRYKDEIAAKVILSSIKRKDNTKKKKVEKRAYPCPDCKGWHLTSRA